MLAEHGSGAPDEPTAACCVHAHMHLIPVEGVDAVVAAYSERGRAPTKIGKLEDLKALEGQSYLVLSPRPGEWLLWKDASRFPRQFVRRAVSSVLGRSGEFDWRAHPHPDQMQTTSNIMKILIDSQIGV
jgi:hypothetical protein